MNPALEYLIHSDLVKEWFTIPCSIFLQKKETGDKLVVTISEEFKPSERYSVKHWNIARCGNEQALPSMVEHLVHKEEVFTSKNTILSDCRLIHYEQESIQSHHNSFKSPMSELLYEYFYNSSVNSHRHTLKRLNWLWARFVRIYAPSLVATSYVNSTYCSEIEMAQDQREIVFKLMKKEWQYWLKWEQHLMLAPAELIFYKEYLKN